MSAESTWAHQILHPIQTPNLQVQFSNLSGYSCLSHLVITHCHYVSACMCVCVCKVGGFEGSCDLLMKHNRHNLRCSHYLMTKRGACVRCVQYEGERVKNSISPRARSFTKTHSLICTNIGKGVNSHSQIYSWVLPADVSLWDVITW